MNGLHEKSSEHKNESQLALLAEECARNHRPDGSVSGASMARHIRRDLRSIRATAARISQFSVGRDGLPQEYEWLLDNQYLLEREAVDAALTLRRAGPLPARRGAAFVLSLTGELCRHTHNHITTEDLAVFLTHVQAGRALSEKELFLFVPTLKAALVASVASLSDRLSDILNGYMKNRPDNPFAAERKVRKTLSEGNAPSEALNRLAASAAPLHDELNTLIGGAVTSLRLLANTDFTELLQKANVIEDTLLRDPAGVYPRMDEASRFSYRQELSQLAKKHRMSEQECAGRVLELCRREKDPRRQHVGYYINTRPLGKKPVRASGPFYFGSLAALTLLEAAGLCVLCRAVWPSLLLLIPLSDLAKNLVDFCTVRLTRPRHVPRLELADGLPLEGTTLCVISALLTDSGKGPHYAKLLEEYRIANRDAGKNLLFGLLADLPDAPQKSRNTDARVIESAQKAIFELNRRHGGGFYLFLRDREFNVRDKVFMGWERKRGALLELARVLRQKSSGVRTMNGDPAALREVKYLITLDGDTRLTAGSAREMVGAMMHPLSRPVLDTKRRVITGGHALLQPRVAIDLEAAGATRFSKIYAGHGGLDPYGGATSDVYQDLFAEASFVGKGILDVDAYLACLDARLPENRILSHDLLEGSFLRCGLIGDVELADGFPARVTSFFDRQHRWTRGDWQMASYLLPSVKARTGREPNPLSGLARWKIFDNLRRSLSPLFVLAALTVTLADPAKPLNLWLGGAALITLASHLLLTAATLFARRQFRARYHSTIVSGLPAVVLQFVLQLAFLPYTAFVNTWALFTALWRQLFSHRRLLEWLTSAEAENRSRPTLSHIIRRMFFCFLWAGFTTLLSSVGWFFGLFWALTPFIAAFISRPSAKPSVLDGADRAFLSRQAVLMWKFFEDFLTPEDHYLPPDNWQEQPSIGLAHRTSPTNIGLALLCALAAHDLKLADRERVLFLIEKILDTMESLPKWHGHIYNWYDTQTLRPLAPRYVSTVDSGNLAACLIALREGLAEMDAPQAAVLAQRADRLSAAMDFSPLYDTRRRLFTIGYEVEKDKPSDSFYDLMASEARQTSYLCVARGDVERRHWRRLGRALVSDDRYSGMASWTGTTFEYLMPLLLMPCYKNSLMYESVRFCLYCQRKRAGSYPWGISESCFYAFDNALVYQYKAHGAPRLAYKRGLGRELVISPYSSFLSLLVSPTSAVKNLRRMRQMGMEGHYGFYEAADFTPSRQTGTSGFETIRCFMSHHVGMSLLSVVSVLCNGVMQKRFMRDTEMGAFAELLQEKVPVGAVKVRPYGREVPEKPNRQSPEGYRRRGASQPGEPPVCHILSNASYSMVCTDAGLSASHGSELALTRCDFDHPEQAPGLTFLVEDDRRHWGLTRLPFTNDDTNYSYDFDTHAARFICQAADLDSELEIRVPPNEIAEWRSVTLTNKASFPKKITLACFFEPVLAREADYEAHPAFSKLFLETEIDGQNLLVHRRPRLSSGDAWLAFACDHPGVTYETSRENVLGRGGMNALPQALSRPAERTQGTVLDPCVLARVPMEISAGGTVTVHFTLSVAATRGDALKAALRTINMPAQSERPGRLESLIRVLGMTQAETADAFEMLSRVLFDGKPADERAHRENRLAQEDLWSLGLSGDLPILLAPCLDDANTEAAARLIRRHRLLSLCGVSTDLVILVNDGGDYHRPVQSVMRETLKSIGIEDQLSRRGGVHLVDLERLTPEHQTLLHSCAVWEYQTPSAGHEQPVLLARRPSSKSTVSRRTNHPPYSDRPPSKSAMPTDAHIPPQTTASIKAPMPQNIGRATQPPPFRYLANGAFQFDTSDGLPPTAWSHILANNAFGALVTDAGAGYLWRRNARENKLTPWTNDPLAVTGGESLTLQWNQTHVSLFAADDGCPTTVTYGFGYARWEKQKDGMRIRTTQFVPTKHMARVTLIEVLPDAAVEGTPPEHTPPRLHYRSEVIMGSDARQGRHVVLAGDNRGVTARNPYNAAFHPQTYTIFTDGLLDDVELSLGAMSFSHALTSHENGWRTILVNGCATNAPGLARLRELTDWSAAPRLLEETVTDWRQKVIPFTIETPDEPLNRYLNGWALYQVMAGRVYGRTSVYQCGGAYGFRDQLQDVCSLVYSDPNAVRHQILRACAHQYEEGDVQHWWHPGQPGGQKFDKGVRTRCSDDLLWLPYTLTEYLAHVSDRDIVSRRVPFLRSPALRPDEHERYEVPERTRDRASVFEHCLKALDLVLSRGTGAHDLLLIGTGDWNDGFNLVGADGRGESVWLTWFAAHVLTRFAPLCRQMGKDALAERYRREATKLSEAADRSWDGQWFKRGYFDDGAPLGSASSEECQIDSIAQSFATLSPRFTEHQLDQAFVERCHQALDSAVRRLVDEEHQVVRLFTPPFHSVRHNPGYIKGYVPGVRENGGQYTHAAVWLAMGLLNAGRADEGHQLLHMLLPAVHDPLIYRAEPYVLAADVYHNPQHAGRGGWSLYTGAAAWYYRIAIESLLGLSGQDGQMSCQNPRLPVSWSGYALDGNFQSRTTSQNASAAPVTDPS